MSKRVLEIVAVPLVAGAVVFTQTRDLKLRGNRFAPLKAEQLTPEQKTMVNDLLAGSRTSLDGPFNVLLRSPEMGNLAQKLGEYIRFHSSVPRHLNEMAILLTAKAWSAQYEWHAHKPLALKAGLKSSIVDDIQAGRRPSGMQANEAAVYDFATELRAHQRVSDATFQAARSQLGEKGVTDLIAVLGYYDLISMVLNVDGYPLPEGVAPPLPEPK